MPEKFQYVVAIDYGTSRTGFAWSIIGTSDVDKVNMCIKWPSIGPSVPKTDSALLIEKNGEFVDWGFEAVKNYDPKKHYFLDRVKMDLFDPDSNCSRGIKIGECPTNGPFRIIKIEDGKVNKEKEIYVVDLIAKSLSIMKELATDSIYVTMCQLHSKNEIHKLIRWVITVPASATDAQKYLMRKAAIKAGLIDESNERQEALLLAYEPEMAALSYYNRTKNLGLFEKEHVMVVIDAGGGTVDVSAHKFNPKNGFRNLDQIVEPRKANAGSTYLDSNFKIYLSNLFSKEVIVAFSNENKGEWHDLLFFSNNSWESIKRNFEPKDDKVPIYVREIEDFIRDHNQYQSGDIKKVLEDVKRHQIMLTKRDFYEKICYPVFENALKPVKSILQSLEDQNYKCDILYFAGGLSCSSFFVDYIKEAIGKQVGLTYGDSLPDVERESVVLKGAVLFGNDPDRWFGSRISQWTYGVDSYVPYDKKIHKPGRAKIETNNGSELVENGFVTYVNKGQSVKVDDTISVVFYPVNPDQEKVVFKIFASTKSSVIYSDEDGLIELDEIEVPLFGTGYNRPIDASMNFGQTEVKVTCCQRNYPNNKNETTVNFNWTHNRELTLN